MIEIGRTKIVKVRTRLKGTRKLVPKLGPDNQQEQRIVADQVWRQTKGALDGSYGKVRGRKLRAGLVDGDCLVLYPKGTRQQERASLFDIYRWMIRARVNRASLEKATRTKAAKRLKRQMDKIRRTDARLRKPLV